MNDRGFGTTPYDGASRRPPFAKGGLGGFAPPLPQLWLGRPGTGWWLGAFLPHPTLSRWERAFRGWRHSVIQMNGCPRRTGGIKPTSRDIKPGGIAW